MPRPALEHGRASLVPANARGKERRQLPRALNRAVVLGDLERECEALFSRCGARPEIRRRERAERRLASEGCLTSRESSATPAIRLWPRAPQKFDRQFATMDGVAFARDSTARMNCAAPASASLRIPIGVVPAWPALPAKTTFARVCPAIAEPPPPLPQLEDRPLLDVDLDVADQRPGPGWAGAGSENRPAFRFDRISPREIPAVSGSRRSDFRRRPA